MEFTFPYVTKVEELELGESFLTVETLESLDDTIAAFFGEYERTGREELFEQLCPYFGVPWPAGVLLASYLSSETNFPRGKSVLELGCGLALPSMILAKRGIRVRAMDVHPDVPVFLAKNLERNGIPRLEFLLGSWQTGAGAPAFRGAEVLIASDILYDLRAAPSLLGFLKANADWDEFYLADPGRPYLEGFLSSVTAEGWASREVQRKGTVRLFQIRR